MAASACRPSTSKIVINKYVRSALQCNVVLDRLEQSSIDQIMRNSTGNDDDDDECTSISVRIVSLRKYDSFIYPIHLYHSRHHRQQCAKHLLINVVL